MDNPRIILLTLILLAISVAVIVYAVRSLWREMEDLADDDAQTRRTEERKNERIARELEQWRAGE